MYRITSINGSLVEYEFHPPGCPLIKGCLNCGGQEAAVSVLEKMKTDWLARRKVDAKIKTKADRLSLHGLANHNRGAR